MSDGIKRWGEDRPSVKSCWRFCQEVHSWLEEISRESGKMEAEGESAAEFTIRGKKITRAKLIILNGLFEFYPVHTTDIGRWEETRVLRLQKDYKVFFAFVKGIIGEKA